MRELTAWWQSPIGLIKISGSAVGISEIVFARRGPSGPKQAPEELISAIHQLGEYFRGERREFALRLAPAGTDFQRQVWAELEKIPFGATATYGGIAAALRNPGAARAVGLANHLNPISIVIPCHRVIGAGSELRGYGGGLWRKRWLLDHERSVAQTGGPAAGRSRQDKERGGG
jgi:methylated-DNA-[protein]-cysteine S-methyltransferase